MSVETTDLPKFTSLEQVAKLMTDLPAVREQLLQRRKEVEAAREKQVAALAKVQSERNGASVAALGVAHDRALAAEKAAQDALDEARATKWRAFSAIIAHTNECDLTIARLEGELRETADPKIGTFIEWAFAALWDERKHGLTGTTQPNGRDPITERERPATIFNNEASHRRRLAAIQDAITAAELLRFGVNADVEDQITALKASIPARDIRTYEAGTVDAALLELDEPPPNKRPSLVERMASPFAGSDK